MKLALTGQMFSGKSTLAQTLRDQAGFYLMNYTDKLKELAATALTAAGVPTTLDDILTKKAVYRAFLQEFGSALGFDEGYGIQLCLDDWRNAGFPEHVVFDNVRSRQQWELLMPHGFVLVRLFLTEDELARRIRAKGITYDEYRRASQHKIEGGLEAEVALDATRTPEQLTEVLCRLGGLPAPEVVQFERFVTASGDVRYRL